MFPWDFAKSAEAMFSRWAIKRMCKFVLKKKLGEYILGDIDLNQLDVQLRQGTIMLSDLALNVDFINLKLGTAPVIVKEGSIGSLTIKIPWKMKNCEIEIEELELVVSPSMHARNSDSCKSCEDTPTTSDNDNQARNSSGKPEPSKEHNFSGPVLQDVHEGVKTIAKVVKLFLTSFHVRLKSLIIAFDPGKVVDESTSSLSRTLVLRVAEIEYGTRIAEDTHPLPDSSLLGIGKLINFVRFHGAVLELLEMNDIHQRSTTLRMNSDECVKESPLASGVTTQILGGVDGVSGVLSLSIPWKNGCLDIHRVDADIAIDPVEVTLQPSTILWLAFMWKSLQEVTKDDNSHSCPKTRDSVYQKSGGHGQQVAVTTSSPTKLMTGSCSESSTLDFFSTYNPENMPGASLPGSHVIHNWIPLSFNTDENYEMDADYGASIDQFFECLDGMRSSQSCLGNGSIWNWTCSVFSAITAASNLASGCGNVPSEQHNVETTLKASIALVTVMLSFEDDPKYSCRLIGGDQKINDMLGTQYRSFSSVDLADGLISSMNFNTYMSNLPFLGAECTTEDLGKQNKHHIYITCADLEMNLQVYPHCTKYNARVQRIKIEDHYLDDIVLDKADLRPRYHMVYLIQENVQNALPPFPFSCVASDEKQNTRHLDMQSEDNRRPVSCNEQELIKITLFETFGELRGEYNVPSISLNDKSDVPSSLTINLPPFIFWVDFYLLSSLMNLFKQAGDSFLKRDPENFYGSNVVEDKYDLHNVEVTKTANQTPNKSSSSNGNIQGNIVFSSAKIILCFNSDDHTGLYEVFGWEKFIALEISPPKLEKVFKQSSVLNSNSRKAQGYTESTSISLDSGKLDVYLVNSTSAEASAKTSASVNKHFFSTKILSAVAPIDARDSMVTMLWQKGSVTGPWMAMRAWNLATQQDPSSRNKTTGTGQEFALVTTAEDFMEANCHVRQEMILSSCFFLHIHLSLICAKLMRNEYELLNLLIDQACHTIQMDVDIHTANRRKTDQIDAGSQVSILIESDVFDLQVTLEERLEISRPMQKELAGSWTSFRLKVNRFDLFSVSDIGGLVGASFFAFNHGEGDLWGSISDVNNKTSAGNLEFLLISCRNSVLRRGDGEGGNAISTGSAGTSVINLKNPVIHESFTSVTVKCGTIIAPGCRLDWFGSIYSFFNLPSNESIADDEYARSSAPDINDHKSYKSHFYLDLVDASLSYEPHTGVPDIGTNTADFSMPSSPKKTSCLLAAASFKFSNQGTGNTTDDYNIRLQDVGFLICGSNESRDRQYDVEYLRSAGYVKVAGDPLIVAVVRTNCNSGLLWEVELSDCHIKMATCRDTTLSLLQLLSQLQQLFAPDMEDFLVHLQSRWTATKQARDIPNSNAPFSSEPDTSSGGLMDEVIDDIFLLPVEQVLQSDSCEIQLESPRNAFMVSDRNKMSLQDCEFDSISSGSFSSSSLESYKGAESFQPVSRDMKPLTDIIESYCVSELLPKQNQHSNNQPSEESLGNGAHSISLRVDETEKGGWYRSGSPVIVENHISGTGECYSNRLNDEYSPLLLRPSSRENCKAKGRVILKNTDIRWMMYGGSDWPGSGNSSTGSDSTGRDENTHLELQLLGMDLQLDMYPDGELFVSKLALSIQDFHLYDNSMEAPWKMVLGYYHSKKYPRETCAKAFKMDLDSVRPDPTTPLEEYRLHLALLPMRLHLDQSQLNFLISFFGGDSSASEACDQSSDLNNGQGDKIVDKHDSGLKFVVEEALLPFFQKFEIQPIVVRVDYIPRHINLSALRGGNYVELVNLVPWKGIDLQLKTVTAVGIYGWGGICETVIGEWLEDISQNQVRKVLKGIKPIRSLFSVSSGAAKLVSLPIKGYSKDRRLVKGIQRGAVTFLRTISLEAVGLGVHLAAGAHDILLQTEYALTSTANRTGSSVHSNQPKDMRQGIQQAYESLSDGLGRTASALIGNPVKTYQRGSGPGAALVSAIRAAPGAAVAPASSAVRAVHCALLGVRNSLDPEHTIDSLEKYHGSSTSRSQDHHT